VCYMAERHSKDMGFTYNTHCFLLPLLSDCLPPFDERSVDVHCTSSVSCIKHTLPLIRFVANDAIFVDDTTLCWDTTLLTVRAGAIVL
jgi:hypothetical protein